MISYFKILIAILIFSINSFQFANNKVDSLKSLLPNADIQHELIIFLDIDPSINQNPIQITIRILGFFKLFNQ